MKSTEGEFFLYEVFDEIGVRYVGIAKNPYRRMLTHLKGYDGRTARFSKWFREAVKSGHPYGVRVGKSFDGIKAACKAESKQIAELSQAGHPLLNVNSVRNNGNALGVVNGERVVKEIAAPWGARI